MPPPRPKSASTWANRHPHPHSHQIHLCLPLLSPLQPIPTKRRRRTPFTDVSNCGKKEEEADVALGRTEYRCKGCWWGTEEVEGEVGKVEWRYCSPSLGIPSLNSLASQPQPHPPPLFPHPHLSPALRSNQSNHPHDNPHRPPFKPQTHILTLLNRLSTNRIIRLKTRQSTDLVTTMSNLRVNDELVTSDIVFPFGLNATVVDLLNAPEPSSPPSQDASWKHSDTGVVTSPRVHLTDNPFHISTHHPQHPTHHLPQTPSKISPSNNSSKSPTTCSQPLPLSVSQKLSSTTKLSPISRIIPPFHRTQTLSKVNPNLLKPQIFSLPPKTFLDHLIDPLHRSDHPANLSLHPTTSPQPNSLPPPNPPPKSPPTLNTPSQTSSKTSPYPLKNVVVHPSHPHSSPPQQNVASTTMIQKYWFMFKPTNHHPQLHVPTPPHHVHHEPNLNTYPSLYTYSRRIHPILDTSSPFYTGILVPETPPRCDEGDEVLCTQGETLAAVEEAIWGGRVGVGEGGGGWEEEGWDEDGWDEDEEVERMLGELWLGDE
ncbi:hypothetical protein BC829DRAFT_413823 [Chytridium lagenaria]|nr:hypothetical protein BC829DRAFT_413823 [Chytridium lagenaria]